MKRKYLGLVTLGLACISSIAFANEVVLINDSKAGENIKFIYKVAHKNGSILKFGPNTTITLTKGETHIPVELDGYQLAGIVPISANGHELPPDVTQFDEHNKKCVAITTKQKTTDLLVFSVEETGKDQKLSCSSQ